MFILHTSWSKQCHNKRSRVTRPPFVASTSITNGGDGDTQTHREKHTTTCVLHVEIRCELSDQVAKQPPAADPQHSENKEAAAARRLMTKNRKSRATRQKTPSSSSNDTQTHTKTARSRHDTRWRAPRALADTEPDLVSLPPQPPSLTSKCFFASFLQQQRAQQQRNSVAAQLPLLHCASRCCVVFLFTHITRVRDDIGGVVRCSPILTTWMRC